MTGDARRPAAAPWIESVLTWAVFVLTAVLSVARLVTRGLESGAFADAAILGVKIITPKFLSLLWALAIDLPVYAGISIVRRDPRNRVGWVLLALYAAVTVWFQAHGPATWMVMASAPVALVLIVVARHLVPALRTEDRTHVSDVPDRVPPQASTAAFSDVSADISEQRSAADRARTILATATVPPSPEALAAELDISDGYARRLVRAHKPSTNGAGAS